jgi:predicted RNA-binding protein (virulence factor B family)
MVPESETDKAGRPDGGGFKIPSLRIRIGGYNRLPVARKVSIGVFLEGKDQEDILLPKRYVPDPCDVGDFLDVFVYLDSEDRLIATTDTPLATAGELAYLEVVAVNRVGAFVDWGLPKDLLVPFREQLEGLERGQRSIVYVYFDTASERLVGSTRLRRHIGSGPGHYKPGDAVKLIICGQTELGHEVIIDRRRVGMLYSNEVFQPLAEGQLTDGFIKQVRPDGKLDVELRRSGGYEEASLTDLIMKQLREAGGYLPVTDKSPPEEIYNRFHASKKAYKRAAGILYRKRAVRIEPDGLYLVR